MDLPFMPSQIELWPIERLRPYARNARLHSDNQIAVLAANMVKFGWTMPCLISDDGELIAGHGRILAATQLGENGGAKLVHGSGGIVLLRAA